MSAMWTPEEAGRVLANRITQPHYVEAIVRKCIAHAISDLEAIRRAEEIVRAQAGGPGNFKSPQEAASHLALAATLRSIAEGKP